MAVPVVLVVDDDKKIVELVAAYLKRDGYQVLAAHDGQRALALARQEQPALIVLDLMMPGMDGLGVCRALRNENDRTPIIMLTARTLEDDRLKGLDLGADDYVSKPFSPRELVARVRAVLRRTGAGEDAVTAQLLRGDLLIDTIRHQVSLRGEIVHLTAREFSVLQALAESPGRAYSRAELVERAFGFDYEGLERTVDVHVMNLRRKIEANPVQPVYIQTVPGVGYTLAEQPHVS
jgi:DNA-binding response OmpR family regulator